MPEAPPTAAQFAAIQRGPEFAELRRRQRGVVCPAAALVLGWYLGYLLLAAFAHDLMSHRVSGRVTVGVALGLLQLASTMLVTLGYLHYAGTRLDPLVTAVRRAAYHGAGWPAAQR